MSSSKETGVKSWAKFLLKRGQMKKILPGKFRDFLGAKHGSTTNDGLGGSSPGVSVLHSPSGNKMRPTPKEALRIYKTLEGNPKKQADLLHQFCMMSSGSDGPYVPGTHSRLRVRQHYYPTWTNEDFSWVIERIEAQSPDT